MNFRRTSITLTHRLLWLFKRPLFWWLTIFVHTVVISGATFFYLVEHGVNPKPITFTDAIYWAIATATTVGYGDVTSSTATGKWLSMGMMILGSLFSALYTAIFASALIAEDLETLETDLLEK